MRMLNFDIGSLPIFVGWIGAVLIGSSAWIGRRCDWSSYLRINMTHLDFIPSLDVAGWRELRCSAQDSEIAKQNRGLDPALSNTARHSRLRSAADSIVRRRERQRSDQPMAAALVRSLCVRRSAHQ